MLSAGRHWTQPGARVRVNTERSIFRTFSLGRSAARPELTPERFTELLRALQAELHAGAVPTDAFNWAAGQVGVSGIDARFGNPFAAIETRVHIVARVGRWCAASWDLHHERGIALTPLLAVAEQLLDESRDAREHVEKETASIRASAWLLSILPVVSPLMGLVVGCSPWGWLFGTKAGVAVAAIGALMLGANHGVSAAIARRAVA